MTYGANPLLVTINSPLNITANFNAPPPQPSGITPATATIPVGSTQAFSATFTDSFGAADVQDAQV